MSFGMISYVRGKQHERKDCFFPAWVPKASGGCGQIVTQRDRPARLKEFQLLDGRSHATLVNIEEGFWLHLCSSSTLLVEHEREIMQKLPRVVVRVADLFAKRGSNQRER